MGTWLKTYTRTIITLTHPVTGEEYKAYDTPHPERTHVVDGTTKALHLSTEIKDNLGRSDFMVQCNGDEIDIIFPSDPTAAEETIIDDTVSDHQSNA